MSGSMPDAMRTTGRSNVPQVKTAAIVEDDEDMIYVYSKILRNLGYDSIFVARNGEEMIRWIAGAPSPWIVIMDYKLPSINGLDVAKEVLRHSPGTKIIMATAYDEISGKAASLGLSFMQKPFSMKTLAKEMETIEP
jgi:DNA-binding NtrC family response regulator